MKKQVIFFLLVMSGLFSSFATSAAGSEEPTRGKFLGTWDLVMKDLPDGDVELQLVLTEIDGKLTGKMTSEEVIQKYGASLKVYDIGIDGKELSFMYTAEGYDVSIVLELVGDDNLEGYMMDMFEVSATRAK